VIKLPLKWVEWLAQHRLIRRPRLLCIEVAEAPIESELVPSFLYQEVRGDFPKWAHFVCPRCKSHIQVPITASTNNWRLSVDWLRRPTLHPSIWETESCGAHFFVRRGDLVWCGE